MNGGSLDANAAKHTTGRFARVALPIPVDRPFTYEVPPAIADDLFVGRRVEVPFGKRVLSGVVTEIMGTPDVPRTRPIRSVSATYLPQALLDISRWIASYYGCSLGEAMQAVLPPSMRPARARVSPRGVVRAAGEVRTALTSGGLEGEAFVPVRGTLARAKKQLALAVQLVASGGEAPLSVVTAEWGYARAVVDALVARGMAEMVEAPRARSPLEAMDGEVERLTPAQKDALERLTACIDARAFRPALLHGVTGSGKTEVYLRAARVVLAQGGGCIVLVPEIGLLPQATARYRRMFGDAVAIVHSRLTGPERFEIWRRVERGEQRVVVGPRSAVFMPVRNLRMIIVDEEQDDSYKQEDKPRYHARAVALMRGKHEALTVVLGSATPSAESLRRALDGKYLPLRLPQRPGGAPLPAIRVVDMRREEGGSLFSGALAERLERNIEAGRQSIIFLNKRGHARYVQCNACGWVAPCPSCDISLTYHRADGSLKCHFCGFARSTVSRCDACKSARLYYAGVGTQRVELDLRALFPGVGVLRMDADTTSGKEGHQRILEEFSTGDYPVLLGTQMVTKGHHFPGVGLVGVLLAEEGLNFPDFRSAERTFQQLAQVAGRSGRGGSAGEVVIQTYMPEHYVFRFLERHDYDGFMREELEVRRQLRYPPFARIVLAACSATDEDLLRAFMAGWAHALRELLARRPIDVLGPAPPLVARIKNRYREQILLRGPITQADKEQVLAAFASLVARRKVGRAVDLRWDVDPETFL
jgi:primosomal protein N' (replication factor Y)